MGWPFACSGHVMRQILALLLAVTLGNWSCFGQSPPVPSRSIEEQIRAIPPASPVELRLADGSKLRGWVSDVSATGFVLTQERKSQLEKKQITFQQTQSVKVVKSVNPSHRTRNILIGVAVGVGAVAIAAAVIFASGSVTW